MIYPCQLWADSSAGQLKMRNVANTAWITIGPLDTASFGHLPLTGGTITGNLTVNGVTNVNALNSAGHGITGALTTTGNATIGGTLQTGGNANVSVASGQNALYFRPSLARANGIRAPSRQVSITSPSQTASAARLTIDTAGLVSVMQSAGVGGNLAVGGRIDVAGTTNLPSYCGLTAPSGRRAYYHALVTGARDWLWGCDASGGFLIYNA